MGAIVVNGKIVTRFCSSHICLNLVDLIGEELATDKKGYQLSVFGFQFSDGFLLSRE